MRSFFKVGFVAFFCMLPLFFSCSSDTTNNNNTPVKLDSEYKALGVVTDKGGTLCSQGDVCVEVPEGAVESGKTIKVSSRMARATDPDTGSNSAVFEFKGEVHGIAHSCRFF